GDRGNLNLTTDLLRLRQASRISTDAQGTATGGNITIDARDGFLVAAPSENSDITANAVFGAGGRVDISALEIFGIQPRESLTLLSDITASSEFGIAGNIVLNTQDLNPVEELTELPNNLTPPQLAQGCQVAENSNSSFTNIGQGGLNPQPDQVLGSEDELLGDVQLPRQWTNNQQIVEAQGWVVDEQGKITLVANVPTQSIELRCEH
ncbi:MAG TPA: filamentous hemagglutinin, partial [Xenococcaceae cyanobacterium]